MKKKMRETIARRKTLNRNLMWWEINKNNNNADRVWIQCRDNVVNELNCVYWFIWWTCRWLSCLFSIVSHHFRKWWNVFARFSGQHSINDPIQFTPVSKQYYPILRGVHTVGQIFLLCFVTVTVTDDCRPPPHKWHVSIECNTFFNGENQRQNERRKKKSIAINTRRMKQAKSKVRNTNGNITIIKHLMDFYFWYIYICVSFICSVRICTIVRLSNVFVVLCIVKA